jgi:hypothetical protein
MTTPTDNQINDLAALAQGAEPVARVNNDGFIVETGLGLAPGTLLYAGPAPKAGEWQPIETAPKDGTRILLGGGAWGDDWRDSAPAVMVGWWEVPRRYDAFWNTCAAEAGYSMFPYESPTHWMPLPAAPAAATEREG